MSGNMKITNNLKSYFIIVALFLAHCGSEDTAENGSVVAINDTKILEVPVNYSYERCDVISEDICTKIERVAVAIPSGFGYAGDPVASASSQESILFNNNDVSLKSIIQCQNNYQLLIFEIPKLNVDDEGEQGIFESIIDDIIDSAVEKFTFKIKAEMTNAGGNFYFKQETIPFGSVPTCSELLGREHFLNLSTSS